ncbi:hypothetical protein TNCV_4107041 [Trichonephila clavipes]|nr:hypothetical protein TNCV_4107041 [Trichonephila clavipes]
MVIGLLKIYYLHLTTGRTRHTRSGSGPTMYRGGPDNDDGTPLTLTETNERKLDLTGASEMNRLYPNSRRESGNENQYLNTLPRRGGGWRKKRPDENEIKNVTRAEVEERKEGGA